MFRELFPAAFVGLCAGLSALAGPCDPAIRSQFNSGLSTPVAAAFDQATDTVWVMGGFATTISRYTRDGVFISTVPAPGEGANDADLDVAPEPFTLGLTPIPAGTLLYANGETGVAEIYAIDTATGAVLATLVTSFGDSHVVGMAYHPGRNTIFLVQDRVPSDPAKDNRVAEINPADGSVLNTFQTTDALASFTVNFGDIEIGPGGNLLVVSSEETEILELTPAGGLVRQIAYPAGVGSISGIGIDSARGEAWVSGTGGTIWRIALATCRADLNCDGNLNVFDFLAFQSAFSNNDPAADFDGNAAFNIFDFLAFQTAFGNGC